LKIDFASKFKNAQTLISSYPSDLTIQAIICVKAVKQIGSHGGNEEDERSDGIDPRRSGLFEF
jgi:hypothetical protein